jgi:Ca2+-transporting ATPase
VNVIRKGEMVNISVYDLLVGDIQQIETGEIISVDGLILENNGIVVD